MNYELRITNYEWGMGNGEWGINSLERLDCDFLPKSAIVFI